MAISKVIYKTSAEDTGTVWMDTTQKTVTSGSMLSGTTALKNDGTDITGSIASKSSSDLTASGETVTAPAGYYSTAASKAVATGTAGTPTATKGTVSNHSVTVTPSVTNTTGYITGGTKSGTAVTVNVSELESGTKSITENGTGIDVSGYSAVDVAVPSSQPSIESLTVTPSGSQQVFNGLTLYATVPTGTYSNVSQEGYRGTYSITDPQFVDGETYNVSGALDSGSKFTIQLSGNFTYDSSQQYNYLPYTQVSGSVSITSVSIFKNGQNAYISVVGVGISGSAMSVTTKIDFSTSIDGYLPVTVNAMNLTTKTITENGTYNASDDNADGYSQVNVHVSGGMKWQTEYENTEGISDWGDAPAYYVYLEDYFQTHDYINLGDTYRITWHDGTQYICVAQEILDTGGQGYVLGNAKSDGGTTGNDEPFIAQRHFDDDLLFITPDEPSGYFTLKIEKQVPVSSGLEYETGVYTPLQDTYLPVMYFNNSHTTRPTYVLIKDTTGTTPSADSVTFWECTNWYDIYGMVTAGSTDYYARYSGFAYNGSGYTSFQGSSISYSGSTSSLTTLLSNTKISPWFGSTQRYFRTGRQYEWTAILAFIAGEIAGIVILRFLTVNEPKSKYIK